MIKVIDENLNLRLNYKKYAKRVQIISDRIEKETGEGKEYLGWVKYPSKVTKKEILEIKKNAENVRKNFDILVVCGVGGSYLGSRAVIDALKGLHGNKKPEIVFVGQTFSSDYMNGVLEHLKGKKFAVNVISKSGTTTEPMVAFRILKEKLEQKLGKAKARKAIFVTTDKEKGALSQLAKKEGYKTFTIPANIGGRYSVFTPVGLFPIAVAGINISKFIQGAQKAQKELKKPCPIENEAYKYAAIRDYLYRTGKHVELFASFEPRLSQLGEWLKQLFGESEGKQGRGLLPMVSTFTTELHSLGQFIQEGSKILFETVFHTKKCNSKVVIPEANNDVDELKYLEGKTLQFINEQAFEGTIIAHSKTGRIPVIILEVDKLDEMTLGYMMYFFMKSCAMSAYLLDVNPFNQPGVEVYKKNMFHLLRKKGY